MNDVRPDTQQTDKPLAGTGGSAHTQATGGLRWGCVIVRFKDDTYTIMTRDKSLFWGPFSSLWMDGDAERDLGGPFASEDAALSALAACPTPPPGWVEPASEPGVIVAGEDCTPSRGVIAMHLMAAIIGSPRNISTGKDGDVYIGAEQFAAMAVECADALLEALARKAVRA